MDNMRQLTTDTRPMFWTWTDVPSMWVAGKRHVVATWGRFHPPPTHGGIGSPHGFRTRDPKLSTPTACSSTPPQFLPLRIQVAAGRRYQFA